MSNEGSYYRNISHIYVEKQALGFPVTKDILARFRSAQVITVRHYKDVFNRKRQDYRAQSDSKKLILAVNNSSRIFEGSDMCQDHGHKRFYYASNVMNCLFDCDYCFLKGMYPTANILMFVNFEDYAADVLKMLQDGPMYLSVSYETDLPAMNGIYDMTSLWCKFAAEHPELTLEIRTKSANRAVVPADNIIYSFTLSPEEIIERYEHHTASLDARLKAVRDAYDSGCKVRLCFDPLMYVSDYASCYNTFMDKVLSEVDFTKVFDISVGAFRISKEYLKNLRRSCPMSPATEFPFVNDNGYSVYPEKIASKMKELVISRLCEVTDGRKIFCDSDGGIIGNRQSDGSDAS